MGKAASKHLNIIVSDDLLLYPKPPCLTYDTTYKIYLSDKLPLCYGQGGSLPTYQPHTFISLSSLTRSALVQSLLRVPFIAISSTLILMLHAYFYSSSPVNFNIRLVIYRYFSPFEVSSLFCRRAQEGPSLDQVTFWFTNIILISHT